MFLLYQGLQTSGVLVRFDYTLYLDEVGRTDSSSSSSTSCKLRLRGSRVSFPGDGEREVSPTLDEGDHEGGRSGALGKLNELLSSGGG